MKFDFLNFLTIMQKPMIMMIKFIIGAVLLLVASDIVYALYTKIYRMRRSIFTKYKNLKEYISSMETVSVLCGTSMDEKKELELLNKNIEILKDVTYLNELLDSKWHLRYIYKGKKHLSEDDFVCELSKKNITKYKPLLLDKLIKSSHEGNIDNLKREIDIINKIESLANSFSYEEIDGVFSSPSTYLSKPSKELKFRRQNFKIY